MSGSSFIPQSLVVFVPLLIVAILAAVVLTVLGYKKYASTPGEPGLRLSDKNSWGPFLRFDVLLIDKILRVLYLFNALATAFICIAAILASIADGATAFLFALLVWAVICAVAELTHRVFFEFLMLQVTIARNTREIRSHLDGRPLSAPASPVTDPSLSPAPEPAPYVAAPVPVPAVAPAPAPTVDPAPPAPIVDDEAAVPVMEPEGDAGGETPEEKEAEAVPAVSFDEAEPCPSEADVQTTVLPIVEQEDEIEAASAREEQAEQDEAAPELEETHVIPAAVPSPRPDEPTTDGEAEESYPRFCWNCGSPVQPGEKFCGDCGASLE